MAKGPLGNSPRDLRDEFIGEDVLYKGGEPPKKTRGPKRVTSNTFHSKVTGATSNKRPDRAGHFRSGGFVRGKANGGEVSEDDRAVGISRLKAGMKGSEGPFITIQRNKALESEYEKSRKAVGLKKGGGVRKYDDGGNVGSQGDIPPVPPPIVPTQRRLSTDRPSEGDFASRARAMADEQPPIQTRQVPPDRSLDFIGPVNRVSLSEPERVPLPRPRPAAPTAAVAPAPRPRPVARPAPPERPADLNPIRGGPGSRDFASGGYKKGGKVK